MTDLSTQTPVEIDTVLYENWLEQGKWYAYALSAAKTIERYEAQAAKGKLMPWEVHDLGAAEDRLEEYKANIAQLREAAAPYQAEYRRRPWKRYYLVTNSNGHVHRGMNCNTCFPTTQYAWIVDLADCDEAVMVEEYGEKACTVCFPDAPSLAAFNGPGRRDRAAVEARQAEKAARQAAKQAKLLNEALRLPDPHNPARTEYPITTIASAKQQIRDDIYRKAYASDPQIIERLDQRLATLTEALLATGRVTQDEIDTIIARARKKAGRG
jgi:hypothetical protein